jgi:hypothetical protein
VDPGTVLQHVLTETEALLAEARVELQQIDERIKLLQCEQYGVQLALARLRREPPPPLAAGDQPHDDDEAQGGGTSWSELSRAEAVLRVLSDAGAPLGRLEIASRLVDVGRDGDDPDAVSAALAYLRRTHRVERSGGGRWVAI